jgi:hypothetical protein
VKRSKEHGKENPRRYAIAATLKSTRATESEGSSRRITTMTAAFMPTREYQCDQPSSSSFGRFILFEVE